jgi:peptide/nickel transport system substrate-binding protein
MGILKDRLRYLSRTAVNIARPGSSRPSRVPALLRSPRASRRWLVPVAAATAIAGLAVGVPAASQAAGSPTAATVAGAVATLPNFAGAGANCIFPLETAACYSVTNYEQFQYLMIRPLYMFGGNSNSIRVNYALSPAEKPIYRDGGKTVVVNLKRWKWSDGLTVNAKDLVFMLNMLEAEKTNYAAYSPGLLPDNIASYSATGAQQVTLHLRHAFSSIWYTYNQLATLYPFPLAWDVTKAGATAGTGGCAGDSAADGWAKCTAVWNFLNTQNSRVSAYATNPLWKVVDGPFRLASYNVDGNYTFVPNPTYSGSPKPSIGKLRFISYDSLESVYNALSNGSLSQGPVPTADLGPARKGFLPLRNPLASTRGGGYSLQAGLQFAIGYAYINFNNPSYGPVFRQLYFRKALMMLDDQAGMSRGIGRGYAYPTVAGVPSEPSSQWVTPAMKEHHGQGPYAYDPTKARALLKAHGWKVVSGLLTCERPGTGSADCGSGIAKGRQAKFAMMYAAGITAQADQADVLKADMAHAGIRMTPRAKTFDALLADTVPCTSGQARCRWTFLYLGGWEFNGPGFEPTGEPLFQTGAPNNAGSYSNLKMDRLINATETSSSLSAFHAYATYSADQVPSLWLPWDVNVEAVSKHMSNVSQNPLGTLLPEYWRCSTRTC